MCVCVCVCDCQSYSRLVKVMYKLLQTSCTTINIAFIHVFASLLYAAPALSITQLWLSNDSVVGVFHAMLPWQSLLQHLADVTTPRPSSYYFVMNQQGWCEG